MEDSVIGEGNLTIHDVSRVIEKSTSCAVLQGKWRMFGSYLGVNDSELPGLGLRINLGTLQLEEVPREILKIWKAEKGLSATLKTLCEALVECGLSDIADTLKGTFCQAHYRKFFLNEKLHSLEELFQNNVPEEILEIAQTYWETHSAAVPIPIIVKELCPKDLPEFYIRRTLLHRNQLDKRVFNDISTKKHIFLVKGATKSELARACEFLPIESSGNQLDGVTVQHILLESDEDFDTISRKTTKPIHLIEYSNSSFIYLKSTKEVEVIQSFIKEDGTSFDEEKLVEEIASNHSPCFLSIADSPGMGKTFLLAKLFTQIQKNHHNSINLFIVLQELADNLRPSNSALENISNYATPNYLANSIFKELLTMQRL